MTKEQIIEILEKKVDYIEGITFDELADAILALPIEMPTDEEIEAWANKVQPIRGGYMSDYIFSAKAMRDGKIIKKK